jgi:hypothetical protein
LLLRLVWVAGWLWAILQAEQQKYRQHPALLNQKILTNQFAFSQTFLTKRLINKVFPLREREVGVD